MAFSQYSNLPFYQPSSLPFKMPSRSDIFYHSLVGHILPQKALLEAGFPLMEESGGRLLLNEKNKFADTNIEKQKCRCQQTISLLNQNWFYARDCRYHPLKVDKEHSWKYRCCGKPFKSSGCVSSAFHTSSYIPIIGKWFNTRKWRPYQFNVFSLDCEFVFTQVGMEVARVSLVCLEKGVVYDTFVEPSSKILDYNTQFSGISPQDLRHGNVKPLSEVQDDLMCNFLSCDTILIGHSLHSDLKGLHICHEKIVDTSIIFPHFQGFPYRYSLEYLAQRYLGITIHSGESGHSSVEDSRICLQLASLKSGGFLVNDMQQELNLRFRLSNFN